MTSWFKRKKSIINSTTGKRRSQDSLTPVSQITKQSEPHHKRSQTDFTFAHQKSPRENSPRSPRQFQNDESAQKLLQIASKSGFFTKRGGSIKTWKQRFFILVGNRLYYFKNEWASEPLGDITVESANAVQRCDQELGKEYCFKIVTKDKTLYCSADSEFTAENWIHALKNSVKALPSKHILEALITGWLQQHTGERVNQWKDIFCALHGTELFIFDGDLDSAPKTSYKLKSCKVRLDKKYNRQVLELTTPQQDVITYASEFDDLEIWYHVLHKATKARYTVDASSSIKGWLERDADGKQKKWLKTFFILQGTNLFYFTNEKSNEPEGFIELTGRLVTRTDKEIEYAFSFKIESASEKLYLKAGSEQEAERWVRHLKEVCKTKVVEKFEKTGWLTKQGGSIKTWKRRWCVLREGVLYYYKEPTDTEPKGHVGLKGSFLRCLTRKEAHEEVDKKHVVKIYKEDRTWYLSADTEQDMIDWGICLKKASLMFDGKTIQVNAFATTGSGAFTTISEAVSRANPMDKIVIAAGDYSEQLTIKKPLHFEGVGDVRIESKESPCMTFITNGACRIMNIKFKTAGKDDIDCISVKNGNVMFQNCEFISKGANCVSATGISQLTMNNCKVKFGKQYGVYLAGKASGLFENNIISNNGWDGIILMGESDAIIRSTTVVDNSYNGIAISSEGRCNVEHCEIAKNIWDGISLKNIKANCVFYNNEIHHNGGYGIYFKQYAKTKRQNKVTEVKFSTVEADNKIHNNSKGSKNEE